MESSPGGTGGSHPGLGRNGENGARVSCRGGRIDVRVWRVRPGLLLGEKGDPAGGSGTYWGRVNGKDVEDEL